MSRRIVASLHGANGVVIQTLESVMGENSENEFNNAYSDLMFRSHEAWARSIMGGCRVVIGIPNDNAE